MRKKPGFCLQSAVLDYILMPHAVSKHHCMVNLFCLWQGANACGCMAKRWGKAMQSLGCAKIFGLCAVLAIVFDSSARSLQPFGVFLLGAERS
jgi:hypothetical protein